LERSIIATCVYHKGFELYIFAFSDRRPSMGHEDLDD